MDLMNIEFYKGLHEKEFERNDSLFQRANLITTVLTTLGGLLGFLVLSYKDTGRLPSIPFWCFWTLSVISISFSCFWLCMSYQVPVLQEISRPSEWLKYFNQLKEYHEHESDVEQKVNADFNDYLMRQFVNVADANISVNTRRGLCLLRSNKFLLAALPLIALSFLYFYAITHGASQNELSPDSNRSMPSEFTLHCIADPKESPPSGPSPRPVPRPAPPSGPPRGT